jgi:hypothetical protein
VTIQFHSLDDGHGLRIRDTAEGEQFPLRTDCAVDPTPASTDELTMPVDAAAVIEASELHASVFTHAVVWQDGQAIHHADSEASAEQFGPGTFEINFSQPGAKLYVRVEDATVAPRFVGDHTFLETAQRTRFVVGVRSHHERPAGTVTVTDDPRDLMAGVSTFGSALKTLSPDRSWPTLRGHPPAIERGNDLDVPAAVEPPDTGITIEVPPAYGPIFTVAPLAFYLGATVEPGEQARLVAGEAVREFDGDALVAEVSDTLEHVFTLDSIVREFGVYPFRTATADEFDERATLASEALFESPLAERTAAYMDVPRSATEGLLRWHYTADVAPKPKYAPALPYLLDELALVRSPPASPGSITLSPTPDALQSPDSALARSAADTSQMQRSVVVPLNSDTPGQSWLGDGYAAHAANPTVGSFRRGLDWPSGDGPLEVHVVYNDARLDASDDVDYDVHTYGETTVSTSQNLSTTGLRDVLQADVDFLHFVGHVTADGMLCSDGVLDVRTLADTGVNAFLLNGCRSYEQGRALLTAGAVGGIVTVDDVADETAGAVGRSVSMLLDAGFPLYAVLDVLELTGVRTDRYTILGDGTLSLRRNASGAPILLEIDSAEWTQASDGLPATIHHYPTGAHGLGGMTAYNAVPAESVVQSARVTETAIPRENLDEFLADSGIPVVLDGALRFTDDLSVADFR